MKKDKNFLWNMIGTTLNSFLSLFLLIIVTRINGIEMSGSFSFIFTLTLILQMFSNYGGRIYQVSDYKNEFSFQEYLGSRVKTSLLSIIFFIIMCFLYKFDLTLSIVAISLMSLRLIETFSDVFYASFQKHDQLYKVGISLTAKALLILLLFLISEVITKNIVISSLGILLASILVFAFYDLPNLRKNEEFKFAYNNGVYNQSKYIFMFGFITQLILNVGRFIGMKTLDEIEIGYLGILMMIPTVMTLISGFIVQPELVKLTKLYEKKKNEEFDNSLKNITKTLIKLSILCMILAITIGPFALKILYQLDFNNYRLAFVLLILAGTFNGLTTIYSNALTIFRKTKEQFNYYVVTLIINLVVSYLASLNFGLNGVIAALTMSMLIQSILFNWSYKGVIQ
jgi:O-antigen/teichoic acid export membrane protein